jgi:hypothetical protein
LVVINRGSSGWSSKGHTMTTRSLTMNQTRDIAGKAAIVAAGLLSAFAAFQVALAAGVPWGGLAWGGAESGQLSGGLRAASAVSAVVLVWMAMVLLTRGGVIAGSRVVPSRRLSFATWAIAGLMSLNTLGNLASGNPFEQSVAATTTGIVAVLAVLLARRGVDPSS